VIVNLSLDNPADYALFLRIKALPAYKFTGRTAEFPDEYALRLGLKTGRQRASAYTPRAGLFDYQRDISGLAIRKERFAAFVEPGRGKTLIGAEFARHAINQMRKGKCLLWVCPSMVVRQTVKELERWYGDDLKPDVVKAAALPGWLAKGGRFGITNQEAIADGLPAGRIGAMVLDDVSLKSHYGAWGVRLIRMGRGVRWKIYLHGTPAPNDRIEYANAAVLLDRFPTVNAFLARYFVNRGQTGERWELKPHALRPFYRDLSHWSIFVSDPAVYGWKDGAGAIPPILTEITDVPLTDAQADAIRQETGSLFPEPGGITSRAKLARIAKGIGDGAATGTNKPEYIRELVESFGGESTLIWCKYNPEQDQMEGLFPDAGSIAGKTPDERREEIIDAFKSRAVRTLISKPTVLGFGLNLQVCTRMVFSTCQDSWEEYYQAVKRANRVGSTQPLRVHIPVTDIERPMVETVLRKARTIEQDTREQEAMFREQGYDFGN
jgi:hypothetical protein